MAIRIKLDKDEIKRKIEEIKKERERKKEEEGREEGREERKEEGRGREEMMEEDKELIEAVKKSNEKEKRRMFNELKKRWKMIDIVFKKNEKCDMLEMKLNERLSKLKNSVVSSVREDASKLLTGQIQGILEKKRHKAKDAENKFFHRKVEFGHASEQAIRHMISGEPSLQGFMQDFFAVFSANLRLMFLMPYFLVYKKAVMSRARYLRKIEKKVEELERREAEYLMKGSMNKEVDDTNLKRRLERYMQDINAKKGEEQKNINTNDANYDSNIKRRLERYMQNIYNKKREIISDLKERLFQEDKKLMDLLRGEDAEKEKEGKRRGIKRRTKEKLEKKKEKLEKKKNLEKKGTLEKKEGMHENKKHESKSKKKKEFSRLKP